MTITMCSTGCMLFPDYFLMISYSTALQMFLFCNLESNTSQVKVILGKPGILDNLTVKKICRTTTS